MKYTQRMYMDIHKTGMSFLASGFRPQRPVEHFHIAGEISPSTVQRETLFRGYSIELIYKYEPPPKMSPGRVVISRCNNIDSASLGLLKFGSGIPISDEYTLCASILHIYIQI